MAAELTPQSIRDVRFREKLRGYNPEDVDAFVTNVAATVESLHRRINELAAAREESAQARTADDDVEESLRRTLILAQRTADMAVKEAQEEATRMLGEAEAQRAEVLAEIDTLRTRTMSELENELSGYRQRLHDERDALQRDVDALQAYVLQERERLRIYFSEQLHRVEEGVPGVGPAPAIEGPETPTPPPASASVVVDEPGPPVEHTADVVAGDAGGGVSGADASSSSLPESTDDGDDDDPFLAELRRAVTDNEPLGPRDDPVDQRAPDGADDDDKYDIFNDDESGGRFLRRRR
jgi:DivIVA domain-containing protein